jgi:TM2 domain-containing membrane protein YozV
MTLWLLVPSLSRAEDAHGSPSPIVEATEDPIRAASFADQLMREDDPYNALTFYRWSLFLGGPEADLRFKIGLAYERGARWEAASYTYGLVRGPLAERAAYRAAICAFRGGEPALANLGFQELREEPWRNQVTYTFGLLALEAHDLDLARDAFGAVPIDSPWSVRARALAQEAETDLPHRSPVLAGTLSIVPGLGQIYAGHLGDGIVAALANGAIGLWSATLLVDGIQRERVWEMGAGVVLGGVFSITYPSNIVGAYRGAGRFNDHVERRRAEELLAEGWDPALEIHATEASLP